MFEPILNTKITHYIDPSCTPLKVVFRWDYTDGMMGTAPDHPANIDHGVLLRVILQYVIIIVITTCIATCNNNDDKILILK